MGKLPKRNQRKVDVLLAATIAVAGLIPSVAHTQESKAPWVLDAFADAAHENADASGTAPVMPTLQSFSTSLGRRFIGPSADSPYRTEFDGGLDGQDQPWLHSRALLPLARGDADSMLFQGNVSHAWTGPDAQPDSGLGLGYRHLFGDGAWLAGANTFVDNGWSGNKARGSFGGELRSAPFDVTMNYYQPYAAGDAGGWHQSAATGYDYDLRLQIPYIPSASVSVGGGAWAFEPDLGLMEAKRLGMSLEPLPYLALDGRVERAAETQPAYTVGVRLTLPLGGQSRSKPAFIDNQPFRDFNAAERTHDMIRRDEAIPVVGLDDG